MSTTLHRSGRVRLRDRKAASLAKGRGRSLGCKGLIEEVRLETAIRDGRWLRGGGLRGTSDQRGHRDLSDHALLADGRVCRRLVGGGAEEHLRRRADGYRDAARGGRGRRLPRCPPG